MIDRESEVIYEYSPEPAPAPRQTGTTAQGGAAPGTRPAAVAQQASQDVDTSSLPVDARDIFVKKEAEANNTKERRRGGEGGGQVDYEAYTKSQPSQKFELPEHRLQRLRTEVAELLQFAEGSVDQHKEKAADVLGADPSNMAAELRALQVRLEALSQDAAAAWPKVPQSDGEKVAAGGPAMMMSPSLVSQIERLAVGSGTSVGGGASSAGGDGRVTYELNYVPSVSVVADSSKLTAVEGRLSELEKQVGVLEPPAHPFADLQTAIVQLQKRVALLDTSKLNIIGEGVIRVLPDLKQALDKKKELAGPNRDQDLDRKVGELYEFCHRWDATAASLPAIVARLRTLQTIHLESASFSTRLTSLEQQQDELQRLLETTNSAVQELGVSLKENMAIVRDNMRSLEEKISKVQR